MSQLSLEELLNIEVTTVASNYHIEINPGASHVACGGVVWRAGWGGQDGCGAALRLWDWLLDVVGG